MKKIDRDKLKRDASGEERRAKDAAGKGEFMAASFHVTSALQKYAKLNDNKKIQQLKALQVEYNTKSEPLQKLEVSVPLDDEQTAELNRLIKSFSDKPTLSENLLMIAKSRVLVPRLNEARKNAENIRPITAQLATQMLIGDDGHTLSYDDFDTTWLLENYGFAFNFTRSLLDTIISDLITNEQYNRENIMNVIVGKKVYTADQLLKIDAALERRFADDYLSAIHILTPLVENTFMYISRLIGLDTITFGGKQTSTRGKNLSTSILDSEEYREAWGEDFCYMLNFFLLEPMSHRFRHKVAHGDIKIGECNFSTFNILFYLYIKMTLMVQVNEVEVSAT